MDTPKFNISRSLSGGCIIEVNKAMALKLAGLLSECDLNADETYFVAFFKKLEAATRPQLFPRRRSENADGDWQPVNAAPESQKD